MDDYGRELWSGATDNWECDANGHLNVRFHIAKQMEALAGLAHEIGMPRAFAAGAEATLVVRDQYIRFLKEARPPDNLVITGGVVEMGETTARVLMVMRHVTGEVAAIIQTIVEHVTSRDMRPFPWPPRVREKVQAWTLAVPADMGRARLPSTRWRARRPWPAPRRSTWPGARTASSARTSATCSDAYGRKCSSPGSPRGCGAWASSSRPARASPPATATS